MFAVPSFSWRSLRPFGSRPAQLCVSIAAAGVLAASHLAAATLPSGFAETQISAGLTSPTAMALAPDGRIFVCEQGGRLRVIKGGVLLPTPFVSLTVSSSGERGLLGVTFDPAFASNRYVYVYYTATTPTIHNRVSRFTAAGDVAAAGSETVLLELDRLSSATNHNGGALHFGRDLKLYVAVGENGRSTNSQTLDNLLGKLLRINSDGTIPADNPFHATAVGKNRAIWALGLRNPFTFALHRVTGRMFVNDVGGGRVGGDQRREPRGQLRLAEYRGAHERSAVPRSAVRLRPRKRPHPGLRDHRRGVLRLDDRTVPGDVREHVFLR
jgi:glucose/arabinose dehydrogenase